VLGSERLTGATLDRLTHRCHIIETRGESYRLHDAKARTRRTKPKDDANSENLPPRADIAATVDEGKTNRCVQHRRVESLDDRRNGYHRLHLRRER
jgi:hypothetical protein